MAEADIAATPQDAPPNGTGLPKSIVVGGSPRLTPNELRAVRATTGKTLEALMTDEADAMQTMVWLKLRRAGYQATWDQAGDVEADLAPEPPDPTPSASLTTSRASVDSGGSPPGTLTR
jgi:hypothetical protein